MNECSLACSKADDSNNQSDISSSPAFSPSSDSNASETNVLECEQDSSNVAVYDQTYNQQQATFMPQNNDMSNGCYTTATPYDYEFQQSSIQQQYHHYPVYQTYQDYVNMTGEIIRKFFIKKKLLMVGPWNY